MFIKDSFLLAIQKVYRCLMMRLDSILRPYGITMQQLMVLRVIQESKGSSCTEISTLFKTDRTTSLSSIELLKKNGLVEYSHTATRRKIYCLTSLGESIMEDAYRLFIDCEKGAVFLWIKSNMDVVDECLSRLSEKGVKSRSLNPSEHLMKTVDKFLTGLDKEGIQLSVEAKNFLEKGAINDSN